MDLGGGSAQSLLVIHPSLRPIETTDPPLDYLAKLLPLHADAAFAARTRHWYLRGTCSFDLQYSPSPQFVALRDQIFKASFRSQQQVLETRTRCLLHTVT